MSETGDACWCSRYPSSREAAEAVRRSAEHRIDGSLDFYLDVSGHDREGQLVYRIVPVLHVT